MKFISAVTKGIWTAIEEIGPAPGDNAGSGPSLKQFLIELLRADNLIVLSGLGSSLSIKDESGQCVLPTMAVLWDAAAQKLGAAAFKKLLLTVKYFEGDSSRVGTKETPKKDIELLLSQCLIAAAYTGDKDITSFVRVAEEVIIEKCSGVHADMPLSAHQDFLRRIGRRSTRLPRTKVFTTNYDLCFEVAASALNFVVIDGFSHTNPQEFDAAHFNYDLVTRHEGSTVPDFIPNVFHLYKLHGSVDWDGSHQRVRRSMSPKSPVLVFPRQSKFESTFDHPFFEMMARFQTAVRLPNAALIVVGCGFGDKHITNPILSAIRSNVGLRALIVDPILETSPSECASTIQRLIEKGDQRLGMLAATFDEFVPYIPDVVAETEREKHDRRMDLRAAP